MEQQKQQRDGDGGAAEADIERLPADLLAHVLSLLPTFRDLSMAGGVSRRWRRAVERSLASRRRLSFAGQRTGDDTAARLVRAAVNLRDLDICWGCQITDEGLIKISSADCVGNLTSISLWGLAGITDKGVVQLVSRAYSLQHLNIGGTFITDESLNAVANSCTNLKNSGPSNFCPWYICWEPPEAPVRNGVLERVDNVKRSRGRPKLTWDESVKRDIKDWNISKEIALDRSAWRLAINVSKP